MFIPISDSNLERRSFPYVNIGIIVVCTIVFIYELTLGQHDTSIFFYKFGLIPSELTSGSDLKYLCPSVVPPWASEAWAKANCESIASPIPTWGTMFTSMFIHGDWMHFLGNMIFLWVFGDNVEDRFGHFRYLVFYLVSGIAAGGLQVAISANSEIPTIGASGAIAGALGAYLLLYPFSRVSTALIFIFITIIRIPAYVLLGFWFFLQFIGGIGELGPSTQAGGVAYWAHIGGFLVGIGVVAIYKLSKGEDLWPRGPRSPGGYREVKYWRGRPIDY